MSTDNKIKSTTRYSELSDENLTRLQNELSTKRFLTIAETGILLKLSKNTVRKLISQGKIIALRAFGTNAIRVDIEKTKAIFEQCLDTSLLVKEDRQTK